MACNNFIAELVRMVYAAGTFAFGANIPKGFTHFVKQKPAGQLYVEYDVDCFR